MDQRRRFGPVRTVAVPCIFSVFAIVVVVVVVAKVVVFVCSSL